MDSDAGSQPSPQPSPQSSQQNLAAATLADEGQLLLVFEEPRDA
jgi:hypothetical protein